ncbi:BTB domain-containing protein [Mycena indigotica]|uniref:BTB domain-containing protein n=1 Tax=Mycena indigotica TaxID=2126181 RepID=A0A8H6TCW7_9AGAR|nr:BTB domain-containing protein [Mycena indigotica]KAF7315165.1 BTB domain-containing protein [Mycena indigotica]
MFGAHAAKRARTDDHYASSSTTRSDIWHSDGSLVLQAGTTLFRVHWSVLSTHSTVFKDMHSTPQPNLSGPTVEGCPVVELHDDPLDLENVLRVLYDPTIFLQQEHKFVLVASLVRLGRKYNFRTLWKAGVGILETAIPTTLDQIDMLRENNYQVKGIINHPGLFVDILGLLRENDILTLLPCAYYLVIERYSMRELFDGVARGDGTTATLAPEDLRQCMLSRDTIIRHQCEAGYSCAWALSAPASTPGLVRTGNVCSNIAACTAMRASYMSRFMRHPSLLPASPTSTQFIWRYGFCASCREGVVATIKAGRTKGWEDLPGFFDLAPWSELKNEE